jgi:hypothetical protein
MIDETTAILACLAYASQIHGRESIKQPLFDLTLAEHEPVDLAFAKYEAANLALGVQSQMLWNRLAWERSAQEMSKERKHVLRNQPLCHQ